MTEASTQPLECLGVPLLRIDEPMAFLAARWAVLRRLMAPFKVVPLYRKEGEAG